MDENRYLILLKGHDKTSQICSFNTTGQVVYVTFADSPREYTYALRDVEILESRAFIDLIDDQVVFNQGGAPIAGIRRVINFGTKVRLIPARGATKIYDSSAIKIEKNGVSTPTAERVLEYWADIAKYVSMADESSNTDTFLRKQFDRVKPFISSRSVLATFLNHSPVRIESSTNLDTVFPFRFNLSQREALNNALRSQISIIEGPPGTGKTQTISNFLANLVLHGKTVAVVSSNNAAVQNVQDKLDANGYGFLVAALGNAANRKRFFESTPNADISNWEIAENNEATHRKQLVQLNKRINYLMKVERERAKLQHEQSAYRLEQEHFETFFKGQDRAETKPPFFFRPTPSRILSFLADIRSTGSNGNVSFMRKLKRFLRFGFIDSKRVALGADALLYIQQKYYKSKLERLSRKITTLDNQLSQESFTLLLSHHQQISEDLFRQRLRDKYKNTTRLTYDLNNYKQQFKQFVETYPIVLSTTHSLRNCIPENFLFDYVIIDESSQVDLVTAALALSCGQNAIIVGDTKQLPHIVDTRIQQKISSSDELVGTSYDYFRHNILSSMLSLYGHALPR